MRVFSIGLFYLPESPHYFTKRGRIKAARYSLSRLRGQPRDSKYIKVELSEIIANEEYERALIPTTGQLSGWRQFSRKVSVCSLILEVAPLRFS